MYIGKQYKHGKYIYEVVWENEWCSGTMYCLGMFNKTLNKDVENRALVYAGKTKPNGYKEI